MKPKDFKTPINLNEYEHKYMVYNTESTLAIDIPTIIEQLDGTPYFLLILVNPIGNMPLVSFLCKSKKDAEEKRDKLAEDSKAGMIFMETILLELYSETSKSSDEKIAESKAKENKETLN